MYVSTSCKYYHSSRTSLLVEKNNVSPLKKTTTLFNPCQSFSTARFDGYFFYNQKSFVRRRLRRCRLRHKIHAIKTRPNNPLRFLQRKNSIRRYSANDLTCAARKATFKTRKRFHNKQYPPKSKVQPHGSERTHFDTGFNNSNVAMHRQTFIFLLPRQIATVQQKTTKTNSQKKQSKISQSKTRPKQTQQAITKNAMFLNIKISQTATCFELTEIAPLIKTQYNRKKTKQPSRHFEIIIQ